MRRSGPMPSVILAVLLTVGAGLPGFEPMAQPTADPIDLFAMTELAAGSNGHYVTKASINNRSIAVLVDTGASAVALSYEDAESVGLRPSSLTFDVPVNTANGVGKAARVTLRKVEIDNVRVSDVDGLVLQKGALDGTLLGMSFLSRLRSFSVENGKLVLKN
jgi:aspartyl protease family protein